MVGYFELMVFYIDFENNQRLNDFFFLLFGIHRRIDELNRYKTSAVGDALGYVG